MYFADAVCQERQVPVAVEQPCFDPGDMGCEPLAMAEGNELVLPAVQQQHGNGDIGQQRLPSNVPACRSQYEYGPSQL